MPVPPDGTTFASEPSELKVTVPELNRLSVGGVPGAGGTACGTEVSRFELEPA